MPLRENDMKVYVQTDIEGIAGFCFRENRANPSPENLAHRRRMYRLLTNEVNAAVHAAFDSGADEVIVNDNHGSGYNILFEELDPRCRIIHGRNGSGPHWLPLLDESFDAMVLIGMHAMGATPCAIIPHSKWIVNDGALYLSEASMAAAIAVSLPITYYFEVNPIHIGGELERITEGYGFKPELPMIVLPSIYINQAVIILLITCVVTLYPMHKISKLKINKAIR